MWMIAFVSDRWQLATVTISSSSIPASPTGSPTPVAGTASPASVEEVVVSAGLGRIVFHEVCKEKDDTCKAKLAAFCELYGAASCSHENNLIIQQARSSGPHCNTFIACNTSFELMYDYMSVSVLFLGFFAAMIVVAGSALAAVDSFKPARTSFSAACVLGVVALVVFNWFKAKGDLAKVVDINGIAWLKAGGTWTKPLPWSDDMLKTAVTEGLASSAGSLSTSISSSSVSAGYWCGLAAAFGAVVPLVIVLMLLDKKVDDDVDDDVKLAIDIIGPDQPTEGATSTDRVISESFGSALKRPSVAARLQARRRVRSPSSDSPSAISISDGEEKARNFFQSESADN